MSAIDPATAYNDLDTTVTITGGDFATGGGTPPAVPLGATALTNVTFVSATTLTATVPWGMDPGTYDLTVTNPDGGTAASQAPSQSARASASGTPATSSAGRCSSSS